jgi:hypothetical protein
LENMPVFRNWLEYSLKALYCNDGSIALPNKNNFYGILCNGTIVESSTKATIIAAEATNLNYTRTNLTIPAPSYDSANSRWSIPSLIWNAQFTESIDFNTAVIIANGSAITGMTVSAGAGSIFTSPTSHSLASAEEIMIGMANEPVPSAISTSQIYYAKILSNTTFQACVSPTLVDPINFTGTANVRLRYAKGQIVAFLNETAVTTIPASTPVSWNFNLWTAPEQ